MNKAVIYARVSSTGDRQDTARQVADLQKYAAASGLEVVKVFEEKASGARNDREVLADCLAFLHAGGADTKGTIFLYAVFCCFKSQRYKIF